MKLRNRAKDNENSKRPVDDDNEEDVDDPEVDSDSDPEWGTESEEKNEMFSMKRKSFVPIPLQMQQPPAKLKKIEPITSTSSSNSETPKAGPSGVTQKSPATVVSSSSSDSKQNVVPVTNASTTPGYKLTTQTMTVKNKQGHTVNCDFKVLKMETPVNVTTALVTKPPVTYTSSSSNSSFANGDFLKDISKNNKKNCIWQVDGMNLLQKFVPVNDEKTGKTLYKSSFTYDGLNAMNTSRFQKVQASVVNKIKNETFVEITEVLNPLEVMIKPEPISEESVTSTEPDLVIEKPSPPVLIPKPEPKPDPPYAPSIANYKNTFKDDFLIFLQALISQSLDSAFLRDAYVEYNEKNTEFFIDKIKVIDDVLEAKKYSLMSLPSFPNNERIMYAIHTYPVVEEKQLPAIKMENFNCVVCAEQSMQNNPVYSNMLLELKGEPYERNTLLTVALLVDVDEELKVLRVCTTCSKILKMYSKMCHMKYLIFKQCERAVQKFRDAKKLSDELLDGSEVVNTLLNNEPWVETKLLQIIKDWVTVDDMKRET
uniref:Proline-rich protein 12 n=2 Tax=Cacopsylla melanoneura TaxID=428564 RepID=A0A8D8ZUZ0_9HEMI